MANDHIAWIPTRDGERLAVDAEVVTTFRLSDILHLSATTLFEKCVQSEREILSMSWSSQTSQKVVKNYARPSRDIVRDE